MASCLSFNSAYQFYPIGNTTTVCLTRDLPPDVPANILLLPCGDPRNILYTLSCEKPNRLRRSLDFTCCDHDPGILARNVLLLTMIMDRVAVPTMWNIFFHMYLDPDSHSTLVSQSQKLAAYASIEAWRSSPYGALIKMGSDYTLAELRRHWELYADLYRPSKLDNLETLQQMMDVKLVDEAVTAPKGHPILLRSAGPLLFHSQATLLFNELHQRYWETGTTFTDETKLSASTFPNSTFLYSRAGEGFDVCPTTDPMNPFHFAPSFGNSGDRILTIEDLVNSAQSQFCNWCAAFQTAIMAPKSAATRVVIRYILGDVLAVARALQHLPKERPTGAVPIHPLAVPRVAPWTTCPMELNQEYTDHGAPVHFDVVDTSNVSDSLGLLNLFLAAAPLLTPSSSSVLYTESFGLLASDPSSEFEAALFAGLSVVAVLMDLVPVDVLSGFTSTCNTHELYMNLLCPEDKDINLQRFTWKRPSSGDPSAYVDGGPRTLVSFDSHQLAKLLHNIYYDMFGYEDPIHAPMVGKATQGLCDAATRVLLRGVVVCPSRESFTAFLSYVRTSLQISNEQWSDVMLSFLDLRSQNQASFDKLSDSDMHAQLYRYGLYTASQINSVCNSSTTSKRGRLSCWSSIPPLVRVFLRVPRAEFAKIEDGVPRTKEPFDAWMQGIIEIGPGENQHLFQSLDAAYGTMIDTGTASAPELRFKEDLEGHGNGADVVFSFVVPSRLLTAPPAVTVGLRVRRDPATVPVLIPTLGPEMCVFSANLEDTDYIHLLPEQPLPLPSPSWPSSSTLVPPSRPLDEMAGIGYQAPVRVELDSAGKQIVSLTVKLEITNTAALAAFAKGTVPNVHISQRSPCTIQVVLGGRTQTLAYPMPIVGSQRKLRLARKSSYIEVIVPVAIPFLEPDGFKVNQFPVIRGKGSLVPWNIHRVFLDQLPILDIAAISEAGLDSWYTDESEEPGADFDALVSIKMMLSGIMMLAAGMAGPPARVLSLQNNARKDAETILFVDKIRYDDAAHTVILDAYVLVVSAELLPHVSAALPHLKAQGIQRVPVQEDKAAWRRLLPALVERCRTTWMHGPNCEYNQADGTFRIPRVPQERLSDPLCSCGQGKDVEGMMGDGVWRMFAPYVTRIALSPFFGVSHVEQILDPSEPLEMPSCGPQKDRRDGVRSGPDALQGVSAPAPVGAIPPMGSKTHAGASDGDSDGPRAATCNGCKKHESGDVKLQKCARCKTALYCSASCQRSDWRTHKLQCGNN